VTLHARGERFMHADGRGQSLTTAMTESVEKLGQQVRRLKGKFEGRKRHGAKAADGAVPGPDAEAAAPTGRPPRRAPIRMPRILKAERQTIRTMSVSDAAAQIDGGEGAVVFLDAETSRIAVLYRAPGGDLTLIETKA
jgi:hypothetical protein